jgi:glucan biosynthesis protein C
MQVHQRRNDLDWLRVGALGLLIVTHVLFVYRAMPWRVQSEHAGMWGTVAVEALAPWRISLVFFIAGAATRFMLERHAFASFVQNRFMRLGVPLIMAVLVLVPPMLYVTDPHAAGHNYIAFVVDHGLHAKELFGFWVPDLGHVWFLPYLLVYSFVTALVWFKAPRTFRTASDWLARRPTILIAAGLAIMFVISDALLKPVYGRSDMFFDDPAGHARCIPAFLLGAMLVRADAFWKRLAKSKRWLGPAALGIGAVYLSMVGSIPLGETMPASRIAAAAGAIFGAFTILAILGFGSTHLQHESGAMRYFSDAIMPIYLLHQPMIIFSESWLKASHLPVWVELPMILVSASLIPLAIYHFVIRPLPPLRILFGLKAEAPATAPAHPGAGHAQPG